MQKRRRPNNAIDGFVPRNRTPRRRASLDHASAEGVHSESIPVNHQPVSSQPLEMNDDAVWSDAAGTITIDGEAPQAPLDGKHRRGAVPAQTQPHFWQLAKKQRIRKGKLEPSLRKKIVKRTIFVIVLLLALLGGFLGWKVLKNTTKVFNGSILGLLKNNTKLKGEENGRVNILLAGTSEDDPGHDGAKLTDSIMIVSIDTVNNKAFMMSIPRDLWVNYQTTSCSVGYQGKINAAYTCGEQIKFNEPGYVPGGMGLLEKIVQTNFGININYYAKIDYTAFKESVDTVNGIDITLKTDSPNGILDRIFDWECKYKCYKVKYPNGPLHLDGQQALDLARARGDYTGYPTYGTGNDFGRTERQRQMLIALKDKALSLGILSNPAKLSSLLDSIGNNVETDFKTDELRRLYDIGKSVQSQNIQSIGLTDDNVNLVETFTSTDGQSAVRPVAGTTNFTQIKKYIQKLTSNDPIIREGAKVAVLNASGVVGLAQQKADGLSAKGMGVIGVGNTTARDTTVIVDLSKNLKNSSKTYLQTQFGVTATTDLVANPEAKNYQADFVIILGKQAATTSSQTSQ